MAPGMNMIDDACRAWCKLHHRAIAGHDGFWNLTLLGQAGVRMEMPHLPMHRYRNPGLYPAIHVDQLVAAGMAGNVYGIFLSRCHDFDAATGEQIVKRLDGLLIAGDDPRREENGITRL